jgi:putative transposase
MLWLLKKDDHIWFWEEGYHGEEIFTEGFFNSKLNYIHLNPVRAGLVEKEEEYLYSSCGDFYGTRKGALELAAINRITNPFYLWFDIANVEQREAFRCSSL